MRYNKSMRGCIVIPVYFGYRSRRPDNHFKNIDSVVELTKYLIEHYRQFDTGINTDIIFVNNSPDEPIANSLFASINNTPVINGIFKVIDGDNIGMSFGAYNKAFQAFQNDYDIWCFTEDDTIYNLPNFLNSVIKQFESDSSLGFAALIGVGSENKLKWAHSHGGCGVTTREKLLEVLDKLGELPHGHEIPTLEADKYDHARFKLIHMIGGEVAFTNCYCKLGYKIAKMNCPDKPYTRWYHECDNYQKLDIKSWGSYSYIKKGNFMKKKHIFIGGHHNSCTTIVRKLILCKDYMEADRYADYMGKYFHSEFFKRWYTKKDNFEFFENKVRRDTGGLECWVIKHNHLMLMIPELKKAFPDSVFIMCIRNPIDQLRKSQMNYEWYGTANSWDPPLVEKFGLYREWIDEGIKNADHIIRLEDLLFDTKDTIKKLYQFLKCDDRVDDDILQMILPPSSTVLDGHRPAKSAGSDPLSILKVTEAELDNYIIDSSGAILRDALKGYCIGLGYDMPEYLKRKNK